ncbi:hypothetical protein VTJ83DRAFT_3924 [Remersonia thermophila]|uniref:Uncharacterized protein n=1 Tax=Remersonia thermophila TaxID=72144 RepID=A0ABR4DFD9_9PEZI
MPFTMIPRDYDVLLGFGCCIGRPPGWVLFFFFFFFFFFLRLAGIFFPFVRSGFGSLSGRWGRTLTSGVWDQMEEPCLGLRTYTSWQEWAQGMWKRRKGGRAGMGNHVGLMTPHRIDIVLTSLTGYPSEHQGNERASLFPGYNEVHRSFGRGRRHGFPTG